MLDGSVRNLGCATVVLLLSAGCQSGPKSNGPETGLASLGTPGAATANSAEANETPEQRIARMANEAAKDIEALRNPAAVKAVNKPGPSVPAKPSTRSEVATAPLDIFAPDQPGSRVSSSSRNRPQESTPEAPAPTPAKPRDPIADLPPKDALAAEMGAFVAKALRTLKSEPGNEGTMGQLVGVLEAIQPGFLVGIEDVQSPIRVAIGELDATEILAHRHLVPATTTPAEIATSTSPAPETVEAPKAEPPKPVFQVSAAHLCSKVTSYGQYEPLGRDTFEADRPIRALVYVELENFENRETTGGRRLVEVSQRLALFSNGGTEEVWSTQEQSVREEGFRARRDFYLVQQVDLPRNLKLGAHSLKVTVTDKVTGAQAETTLPIRIVSGDRAASGQ